MKKTYIVIISVIIIYFLLLFFFFGINKIKSDKREATIILDHNTIFNLEDSSWHNSGSQAEKEKLNWQEFTVFLNYKNIGKHYLWYNEKWYLFDKDKKPYNYEEGAFLALQANYEIKVLNINAKQIEDMTTINKVLAENNIRNTDEFTVQNNYQFDFDNDGIIENFYTISNAFAEDATSSQVFSIAFMEKEGSIQYLYKSVDENNGQNSCKPYINTVLDLTEDNIYEIILSCGYYSIKPRHDMLFTYKNNEFKLVLSNQ